MKFRETVSDTMNIYIYPILGKIDKNTNLLKLFAVVKGVDIAIQNIHIYIDFHTKVFHSTHHTST